MKNYAIVCLIGITSLMVGCAVEVPSSLSLSDPMHRHTVDAKSTNPDAIRKACVETMLNASPATEATQISARAANQGQSVMVQVDAFLLYPLQHEVAAECVYTEGKLASFRWTSGLK